MIGAATVTHRMERVDCAYAFKMKSLMQIVRQFALSYKNSSGLVMQGLLSSYAMMLAANSTTLVFSFHDPYPISGLTLHDGGLRFTNIYLRKCAT
jgi:hypothetical protein